MTKNIVSQVCRFLLLLVFAYTVYHKLVDMSKFESTLLKSTLIDVYQVKYLLYLIPAIELTAIFFLLRKDYLIGLYISLFVMLLFTIYLVALNNFSFYKGCSCGGIFNEMSYAQHILVNIILVVICLVGLFLYKERATKR
jgi:hypothetical protein